MCFSATASFSASSLLAIIGLSLLMKIKNPKHMLLALIPVFFAIQQAAEGFVWLAFPQQSFYKYIFLFFAYVFWPIWVPIATWFAEPSGKKKYVLAFLIGIGTITGFSLGLMIPNTSAIFHKSSIAYINSIDFNLFRPLINIGYVMCCLAPLFIASIQRLWIIGIFAALSGSIVWSIDHHYAISMWCFFAALCSSFIWLILPKKR